MRSTTGPKFYSSAGSGETKPPGLHQASPSGSGYGLPDEFENVTCATDTTASSKRIKGAAVHRAREGGQRPVVWVGFESVKFGWLDIPTSVLPTPLVRLPLGESRFNCKIVGSQK